MLSIKTVCRMMLAISSHRDQRGSKMRVLILSVFLACAAAAPSGLLAPVPLAPVAVAPVAVAPVPLAYTSIVPTISPGDIQAAAIDAQVKAQDQAIAAVDKARELSELAVENLNEKSFSTNDQIKEKVEEQFWSVEEQKWQALDALKTAEAQIDGSVASNADALAKSAVATPFVVGGVVPAPIAFAPGIVAPVLKTAEEPKEVKEEKPEAAVKTAEEAKDSVAVEAVTAEEKPAEVKSLDAKPLVVPGQFGYPIVAPIVPPVLKYTAGLPYVQTIGLPQPIGLPQTIGLPQPIGLPQTILAPTVYKTPIYNTVW